eukprot:scaffold108770_cov87-Phaeocystis_antarctica.AAC.1
MPDEAAAALVPRRLASKSLAIARDSGIGSDRLPYQLANLTQPTRQAFGHNHLGAGNVPQDGGEPLDCNTQQRAAFDAAPARCGAKVEDGVDQVERGHPQLRGA